MDKITQRLLGVAAIIFAVAFLIQSASPAQADNAPQTTYGTGKYQMQFQVELEGDDDLVYYMLVWDTETGRSKMYYGSPGAGTNEAASKFQLPSSPL
ncbi:hypothetical protein [Aureispira anguillae]|uniref:Uncharacterized protein n=1 Tax=Aureispira anguillae TaxID=2864201 RepID=A0A915YIT8_9BACT|nr:hypothetical protein [Aureispira anguillae]BDS13993.1 hypothetical protein AsAng_0047560 [Aureispira anguillae]